MNGNQKLCGKECKVKIANHLSTISEFLHKHKQTHYVHTYKKCVAETLKDDSKSTQTRQSTPKPDTDVTQLRSIFQGTYAWTKLNSH